MATAPQPRPLTTVQPRRIPIAGGYINVYPNGKRVKVLHGAAQGWGSVPNVAARGLPTRAPSAPRAPKPPGAADWANLGKITAAQRAQPAQFAPDSQYLGDAAARTYKMNADLQNLQQQGITDAQSRQTALGNLARQQPVDLQQASVNRNRQGLFYSSTLGNDRANINAGYVAKAGDVENQFAAHERARAAAEAAIRAGYSVDDAAAMAAAADRQITRDTASADANALVPNPVPKPKAPKPKVVAPRIVHTQRQPTTRGRRPRRRR